MAESLFDTERKKLKKRSEKDKEKFKDKKDPEAAKKKAYEQRKQEIMDIPLGDGHAARARKTLNDRKKRIDDELNKILR